MESQRRMVAGCLETLRCWSLNAKQHGERRASTRYSTVQYIRVALIERPFLLRILRWRKADIASDQRRRLRQRLAMSREAGPVRRLWGNLAPISWLASIYSRAPVTCSLLLSSAVTSCLTAAYFDYRTYLSLGGGGPLPRNIFGWAIHACILRPISLGRYWTTKPRYLPPAGKKRQGHLDAEQLPQRRGPRPKTEGVAPHRQVEQLGDGVQAQAVLTYFEHLAASHPSHVLSARSQLEPGSAGLFSLTHSLVTQSSGPSRSTRSAAFPSDLSRLLLSSLKGGEFAHLHPTDGSMHMVLHPHDAQLAVERGWAELHALAGCPGYTGFWIGWPAWIAELVDGNDALSRRWWHSLAGWTSEDRTRRIVNKKLGLPPTYVMVYAPRDAEDMDCIKALLRASALFATGLSSIKEQ